MTKNKQYNRIKLVLSIASSIFSFLLLSAFVISGYSEKLLSFASAYSDSGYLQFIIYVAIAGIASSIISFPLSYYSSFHIEHKFDLSNQTFFAWMKENLKGAAVGSVIGLPILMVFYYFITEFTETWWLPFAIAMFLFSVVLAQIVPVVILPLFYKVTPLEDEELTARIKALADKSGLRIKNVYKFDMSKNTKKANAAFTGLGKTKRIILGDTLLEDYTPDEIETVIAHEMGHYAKKHIVKNLIFGTLSSFLTLWLIAELYRISLPWFGFESITNIAAFPILSIWAMLIGIIQTPLSNYLSRKYEYEADNYAIKMTNKKEAFISTLTRLNEQNLGDEEPHPLVEWYSYSHPSIKKRIAYIESL
ncbi:MAG: peptidase [Melioribacteraceae bacterium]|nr:MAG: peptidase [Melioribacteraceae bacterium]